MSLVNAVSTLFSVSSPSTGHASIDVLQCVNDLIGAELAILCRNNGDRSEVILKVETKDRSFPVSAEQLSLMLPCEPIHVNEGVVEVEQHTLYYLRAPISASCGFTGALFLIKKDVPFGITASIRGELDVVTQLIATQYALQTANTKIDRQDKSLRSMEQLASIGWWEVDLINNTIFWSPQTRAIHEVPETFVPDLNTAIEFYKAGDDRDAISSAVFDGIYHGRPWDLEVRLVTYNSTEKWVAALGTPEIIDGQCVRLFGAFQDIDEQKRAHIAIEGHKRDLEALLHSRTRLLSRVSHELRTPLNAVHGMLHSIDDEFSQQALGEKLAIAKTNAAALVRLIGDIDEFNQVSQSELTLYSAPFSLHALIQGIVNQYKPLFNEKGLHFEQRLNLVIDKVLGDEIRVRQVITHLLDNALKFTPSGSVMLQLSSQHSEDNVLLKGSVIDTGIGISDKDLPELFQPFKQTSSLANLVSDGKGLGLSTVKEICTKLAGQCSAESEFGKGSVFHFKLMLVADNREIEKIVDTKQPSFSEQTSSILLVDDVDTNRLVAEVFLNELGLQSDHAVNGQEALSALENRDYDIIFMDCHMPVMDGFEATQRIKAQCNGNILIVAMTADITPQNEQRCYASGMDMVIMKPLTLEKIVDVMTTCTARQTTT